LPTLPFASSASQLAIRLPPPLGEHTREVLAEAGIAAAEIGALPSTKFGA
jgi:crotonobetainyl-CoA:carnitine CoA-transferase CaiB-like acyl-CoA transferase